MLNLLTQITAVGLFASIVSFSIGQDVQADKNVEATHNDRVRIYCSMVGHSETYCQK